MNEEPFFVVNEFLEKERNELANIVEALKGEHARYYDKAVFLRNFTNLMFKAYQTKKYDSGVNEELLAKRLEKIRLEKQKQELMKKLQEFEQKNKNVERKEVIISKESGETFVSSSFDGTKYLVKEPILEASYQKPLLGLKSKLNLQLLNNEVELKKAISAELKNSNVKEDGSLIDKLRYYLVRDLKRYGLLSPLIEDKKIREIVCNGAGKNIHINYDGNTDVITNIVIDTDDALNKFIEFLAGRLNQKISKENPFLSGELEKGLELQATYGSEFVKPKFVITRKR